MNGTLGWAQQGWRVARDSEGTEIAEAAVVLPLVFLFIFAILWFGLAFNTYGTITAAAREGARYASAPTACSTCGGVLPTDAQIDTKVTAFLQTARLDPTKIVATYSGLPLTYRAPCQAPATSTATQTPLGIWVYRFVVVNSLPNGSINSPQQCGVVISFQYPFGNGLPFPTYPSFSLQAVTISATSSSQMQN